jgi:CheY-like chemotaxis protein
MLGNLIRNAAEAMNESGGDLILNVNNVLQAATWKCLSGHVHPGGEYVHIAVCDTGPGIPGANQHRIFEPFFTTRFLGRGLGLPAALGIVQNHGGCLSVESKPGQGATFHVYLPRLMAEKKAESRDTPVKATSESREVLVVDDEPAVLQLLDDMLTLRGMTVTAAHGGVEALDIYESRQGRISLVILDIRMAGMDGKRVYRQLKARNSYVPIIVASGLDEDTALGELKLEPGDRFLQKPFRMPSLMKMLDDLMEAR